MHQKYRKDQTQFQNVLEWVNVKQPNKKYLIAVRSFFGEFIFSIL
jgi:hypothetical protein